MAPSVSASTAFDCISLLSRRFSFSDNIRDFKIQRRGRRRERPKKKNNRFYKQNNSFVRASHFLCTFLSRFCTTTTWKCLISCFMEDVNKQRRNYIYLSELGYGPLKFSFRRVAYIWQSNWVRIILIETERTQIHFLKWRSRGCRVVGA